MLGKLQNLWISTRFESTHLKFKYSQLKVLGHESTFLKLSNSQAQVKAQESQSLRSSQASSLRDQASDPRWKDPRLRARFDTSKALESEASETHMSEASKTFESEDFEFEALTSETLEFRDCGFKPIWIMCDIILSTQFKMLNTCDVQI